MHKYSLYISTLIYILLSLLIFTISNNYIKNEEKRLLDERFTTTAEHMKKSLSSLIKDKKNATLAIAISSAKDQAIKEALLKNNSERIDLIPFSKELRKKTNFKNVWFQVLDKEGRSLYRSWTKKRNDALTFRPDVKKVLKEKEILASISVGRFDMTFKSMVPIFSNGEFIGIFEVITHFNSISKTLENDNIDSIVLAHKKFKKKLTNAFTKRFIDNYYIANLNAKEHLIKLVDGYSIEKTLDIKNYELIKENLLTTVKIIELDEDIIGYVILSKDINNINIKDIETFKQTYITYLSIFILLIGLLFISFNYYFHSNKIKKFNKELEKNLKKIKLQKNKNQTILDSQKNIIVITDGKTLQNANEQLLIFYDDFKSLDEFKEKYECICETFIEIKDDDSYVIDKDYDGNNWAEHILANPKKKFKAAVYKENRLHHFTVDVNLTLFEDRVMPFIIVTLTDITHVIEQNKKIQNLNENLEIIVDKKTKELKELNENLEKRVEKEIDKSKEKDRILFQQSKMASMGEMLENIAHQWRQPLNSISTAASTLKLQKDLNLMDSKQIDTSCEFILRNSYYLSQTIEDFKNFFKQDKEKKEFNLKESLEENLNLLKDKLKHNEIDVIMNIENEIKIYGFKNEFQQSILNIINNSIDAFNNKNEKERIILIEYYNNKLEIKDSAGGVEDEIIEKIFEPYFTTKHQSQGTGIGLYMTKDILTRHMNCKLETKNSNFKYLDKNYRGLSFIISFK